MMKRSLFSLPHSSHFKALASAISEWKWLFVVKIHEIMSDMYHNEREWEDDVRSISMCRRHALEINVPPVLRCVVVRFERCLDVTQRAAAMMMWCDTKGYGSSGKKESKLFCADLIFIREYLLLLWCGMCWWGWMTKRSAMGWQKRVNDDNKLHISVREGGKNTKTKTKTASKLWVIVLLPVNGGC